MAKKKPKNPCTAKRKDGKPCTAPARKDQPTCWAHAPKEEQEKAGFGGAQPGAGRPRVPRPSEVIAQVILDNIAIVLKPYFKALGYDVIATPGQAVQLVHEGGGAKVIHRGWDGERAVTELSEIDDLGAQMQAAELLLNRAFGKPRQALELTGDEGGPIETSARLDTSKLSTDELRDLAKLMAKAQTAPEAA